MQTDEDENKLHKPLHLTDASTRAASVIVLQPGSKNLRIGWANEDAPQLVPHCIARLWHSGFPSDEREEIVNVEVREKELAEVERGMKRWSAPTQKLGKGGAGGDEEEVCSSQDIACVTEISGMLC